MEKTTIIGNLVKDPELHERKGFTIANFNVAVNGRKDEAAKYFRATAWNGAAETIAKYAKKGSKIYLEGEIGASAYTGSDGALHTTLELNVQRFEFLGEASRSAQASSQNASQAVSAAAPQAFADPYDAVPDPELEEVEDDDLPF